MYAGLGVNRYLPPLMVDHHVMGLNVSVHNPFRVTIVQGLSDISITMVMVKVRAP